MVVIVVVVATLMTTLPTFVALLATVRPSVPTVRRLYDHASTMAAVPGLHDDAVMVRWTVCRADDDCGTIMVGWSVPRGDNNVRIVVRRRMPWLNHDARTVSGSMPRSDHYATIMVRGGVSGLDDHAGPMGRLNDDATAPVAPPGRAPMPSVFTPVLTPTLPDGSRPGGVEDRAGVVRLHHPWSEGDEECGEGDDETASHEDLLSFERDGALFLIFTPQRKKRRHVRYCASGSRDVHPIWASTTDRTINRTSIELGAEPWVCARSAPCTLRAAASPPVSRALQS